MKRRRFGSRDVWGDVGRVGVFARNWAGRPPALATPLVLVHGLGVSSRYMMRIAERFAGDRTVWAPDLPGFGWSGKPAEVLDVPGLADALVSWLDVVGLERVAALGNSMGCQIIAHAAVRHPRRFERVVLQGPTVDAAARTARAQIGRWFLNSPYETPVQAFVIATDYAQTGPRRFVKSFRHMLDDRIEDVVPHIGVPTLVVRGSHDRICPREWCELLARIARDGRLREVPGGGHTAHHTYADEVARVVRPFLAAGDPGRPAPTREHANVPEEVAR